ncbi:dnaJ domain protein [Mycobacterium xenopi 3993]|nr:dnaJ domain protein [Mycobacterium xenopi 3993]
MAQREWVEKDFYKELGVSPDASQDDIKRAYRKLARELHPDANRNDPRAAERFKAVSEAHSVLSDPAKRKEYDETRRLFAGSGGSAAASAGQLRWFRHGRRRRRVQPQRFVRRRKPNRRQHHRRPVRGLVRSWSLARPSRPRRGNDLETEAELSFVEAAKGVAMPLRLTSPAPCTNCHGSGARPGTSPRVCPYVTALG